jgi:uncharacterized protein (TIGR02001 family)
MRKSLLLAALLGAGFVTPGMALADDAAPAAAAAAAPASPHTVTYNVGLFSQYIWRGMTQTDESLALQGGVDYAHSSGLYAGAWASNVSWTTDQGYMDSGSLELDLYGGYANTFGQSDFGYNVGVLQYLYPGDNARHMAETDATELYGALTWKWANVKASYVASDEAWGFADARGTWYTEANADIPVGDSGFTINLHAGRFMFDGSVGGFSKHHYNYNDWKVGVTKAWDNGIKVGAAYTDNDAESKYWTWKSQTQGQLTVFVQKVF